MLSSTKALLYHFEVLQSMNLNGSGLDKAIATISQGYQ